MAAPRRRNRNEEDRFQEIPITSTSSSVPWTGPVCVGSVWTPPIHTAFKMLLSFRLVSAIWSNISDCDETYNYWEPAHYMLYGNGFQTWEYSPRYAIRSYSYILLHVLPVKIIRLFTTPDRISTFYLIRCLLAIACASCETYFYRGVIKHYGASVARLTLAFLLLSTGMFISAAAFLPSSFSMYMTMLSMGAWYSGHLPVAIFSTAVSTFLGWPFAAVLGLPLAIDILYRRKKPQMFVVWCIISLCLVLAPMVYYDSLVYGKFVVAPLNIVMYNVLTSHGPDLYGTEPWTFYFINGFLNFNLVFLLALPVIVIVYATQRYTGLKFPGIPHYLALVPMYIWILIFFSQAHKEERFLFPIYPLFCVSAALSLDALQRLFNKLAGSTKHYTEFLWYIPAVLVVISGLLSISRNLALYHGYHAPMDIYTALNNISHDRSVHRLRPDAAVSVCMGKEWYRYPSSFFLASERWKPLFLKSEFRGQLPGRYGEGEDATRVIPHNMNDMNREEPSRYMDDIHCHYLVDLDTGVYTDREPDYTSNPDKYKYMLSLPFLNNDRSHRLFRAFYVPYLSDSKCTYGNYTLYQVKISSVKMTEPVKQNGSSSESDVSHKVFDLSNVHRCFANACLENGEISLTSYCNAWHELNKFLDTLGTLFTFVTHDVKDKLGILEAFLKADPEHYDTVNNLLQYEVDNKLTKTKKPSASRTLLRLHRALAYILSLFERLVAASADAKVSTISREAYDATLSKHHTWIVRKACNLAMYSLPLRSVLLHKIDDSEGGVERITTNLTEICASGRRVYDITEGLYTQHKLHDLP